jgi:hypothetical protein
MLYSHIPIPKTIHKIWFGSMPKHQCLNSIMKWTCLNRNRHYETKLRTSSASMIPTDFTNLELFCKKNSIILANIKDEIYNDYPNINMVKDYLALEKMGTAKYHGTSNVLRL